MCGENQSIKNVYGTSDTAKECREIAQQLNQRRGEKMDEIQVNLCQKLLFLHQLIRNTYDKKAGSVCADL